MNSYWLIALQIWFVPLSWPRPLRWSVVMVTHNSSSTGSFKIQTHKASQWRTTVKQRQYFKSMYSKIKQQCSHYLKIATGAKVIATMDAYMFWMILARSTQ